MTFDEAFELGECEWCECDPVSCQSDGYCKQSKKLEEDEDDGRTEGDI